ncbi:5-dehydro-4-deoxyglucarate dehydratase [Kitasatospora herbaricolor]|uniref:Probable 5-dehydro-4-deoxyglucarate dehydratase n=1 Tax=Kitasatospora herbaricolor TaxID=68217 RepID=A0ABZ1WJ56_9ACTN|nr:5-dehydro-4-deoxyglucarate dehydratase [Kitasatospora herbaricolor]
MPQLDGVLFFPVTPFGASGAIDLPAFRAHLARGLAAGPGGVFVACGTGEFHALDVAECEALIRAAVEEVAGAVPVYCGTGGPLPVATRLARVAESSGADGLLLLPPYLVSGPPQGLVAYTRAVAAASELPVIVYNRATTRFDESTAVEVARIPNVTGFKDGIGDLDSLARIVKAIRAATHGSGKDFQFFNGMPTAEVTVSAYRAVGVELYSSAVFCFAPEISLAFYEAVTTGNAELADRLLGEFFNPLVELRDLVPGYAVSLVKAAVTMRGPDVGGVRPPLADPVPEHLERLREILAAGLAAIDMPWSAT